MLPRHPLLTGEVDGPATIVAGRGVGDRAGPAARNPFSVQNPDFVEQVVVEEADRNHNSLLVVDNGDERRISPSWLVDEIMSNATSSINVLTERDHVMPPNSGYHYSLFANYTLDGIKAVLVFTMSSTTGGPLPHSAFQPFTWPVMFDTNSGTYVDVKVFNGDEVLFHWVLRGYRSDSDLWVQQQFCDEVLIRAARARWFRPSVVICVFVGWKVSVTSFEVGAKVYLVGPRGSVVASDHARSNCELRVDF